MGEDDVRSLMAQKSGWRGGNSWASAGRKNSLKERPQKREIILGMKRDFKTKEPGVERNFVSKWEFNLNMGRGANHRGSG